MPVHKTTHIPKQKKETVKKIADLIKKYSIIGSINMENLPAAQLQKMTAQLRGKVEMIMTKSRLMKLAIEQAKADKKGVEAIEEYLKGMPALLFTNENPFALFKMLKKSKTKAPAKAGQTAPSDIIVKAGPTSFAPGPVIGELGALGIKSKVESGKIAIIEDAVVCKEGEEISGNLAGMLTRLGIEPMEIGLDLVAVYEKGDIFTKSILDIDEDKFMADLSQAATWAVNLSCEAAFLTELNREMLIQKAFRDAKGLALEANILADAVVEELLGKAERQMKGLQSVLPEMPAEAPKAEEKPAEPAKEEPKVEEKAPEPAKEEAPKAEEKKEEPKEEPKVEEKAAPEPEKPKEEPKPEPEEPKVEEKPAEEPKKEEPKVEEKPKEEPKAEEKAPEPKAEEKSKDNAQKKVENIIEQAKMKEAGKPIAEQLVEEAKIEGKPSEKAEMEKVENIAQQILKKGSAEIAPEAKPEEKKAEAKPEEKKEEKKEEKSDVAEVEDLTKELLKKGTLRK